MEVLMQSPEGEVTSIIRTHAAVCGGDKAGSPHRKCQYIFFRKITKRDIYALSCISPTDSNRCISGLVTATSSICHISLQNLFTKIHCSICVIYTFMEYFNDRLKVIPNDSDTSWNSSTRQVAESVSISFMASSSNNLMWFLSWLLLIQHFEAERKWPLL